MAYDEGRATRVRDGSAAVGRRDADDRGLAFMVHGNMDCGCGATT